MRWGTDGVRLANSMQTFPLSAAVVVLATLGAQPQEADGGQPPGDDSLLRARPADDRREPSGVAAVLAPWLYNGHVTTLPHRAVAVLVLTGASTVARVLRRPHATPPAGWGMALNVLRPGGPAAP